MRVNLRNPFAESSTRKCSPSWEKETAPVYQHNLPQGASNAAQIKVSLSEITTESQVVPVK